jgi:CubicO group peptidase (beta-lactamase class C family)
MRRRQLLQAGLFSALSAPVFAAVRKGQFDAAADVLAQATSSGVVASAVLHVKRSDDVFTQHFGQVNSNDAMFLLGSISKPVCVTALMTLFDQGEFQLDQPVQKFLPAFRGDGRERITMQHVLTHVSGLPDQLADNNELRKRHAGLSDFVDRAIQTPLLFAPGSRYGYSSMGILLATHIAEKISGTSILKLVDATVFQPLKMKHSAQGLGNFALSDFVPCQTEHAAPESGAGDPTAKDWDWNSPYWRKLGAPWGGTHASAGDIGLFLDEFLREKGAILKPSTAKLMVTNHNPPALTSRGIGFNVGKAAGSAGCSDSTFGHTGSTGTLAWADRTSQTICVVLTSLPGRAVEPHPRELTGARVAAAVRE